MHVTGMHYVLTFSVVIQLHYSNAIATAVATAAVMEDNAPVHKKVCIPVRKDLRMETLNWPPTVILLI